MSRAGMFGALVLLGAGWGLTQPLSKIAVSGQYRAFGLIFWQLVICVLVLGAVTLLRGRRLPLGRDELRLYAILALIGTVLPNAATYQAAVTLPAGIIAIIVSLVPILAFPMALAMGMDRFGWPRFGGLMLGLAGAAAMSLPGAALTGMGWALLLGLGAPLFYAAEGIVVARLGTYRADAVEALLGASIIGLFMAAPLALATGQWIDPGMVWQRGPGAPDVALMLSSVIHAFAYAGYVALIGRAGAVFAVQASYLVTGFGVVWSMLLLGESYPATVWLALAMVMAGVALVQPRAVGAGALEGAAKGRV